MRDYEKMEGIFKKNKVSPYTPINTLYTGYEGWRGYETLKRTRLGWIRTIGHNGEKQLFDLEGNLVKLLDPNGNYVLLKYKNRRLFRIENSFKAAVTFSWNARNYISSIRAFDKGEFSYKYSKYGTLTEVKHSKFGRTSFEYDHNFNLVKIVYPTGDKKIFTYDSKYDLVTSEKGPGRLDVKYRYGHDPKDKKHYWTIISVPMGRGYKEIDRWEFWEDQDKYLRVKDGSRIITKFSKFGSGSPSYINRDGRITRFKYNSIGQPIERILPNGSKIITRYDRRYGKPKKVTDGKDVYYYTWNKKGNVVQARDNKGLKVSITYDSRGRIKTLRDNKKGTLHFDMNLMGKPTKIMKKGVGAVLIWYDSEGKIIKIKTKPENGKIASVIIATFNELFGLLKYAGI